MVKISELKNIRELKISTITYLLQQINIGLGQFHSNRMLVCINNGLLIEKETMILCLGQILLVSWISACHALNASHALQVLHLLNFHFFQVNVRNIPLKFGNFLVPESLSKKHN